MKAHTYDITDLLNLPHYQHIVINNAGEVLKKPFTDISEEEYDRLFAVNAKAPFFVMQEALKILEDNGRIVNIGTTLLAVTTGCK